jgi:hypothetical protein
MALDFGTLCNTPVEKIFLINYLLLFCKISGFTRPKVVIPAWIAEIQVPWRVRSSPSMALDTRFPAGMTVFLLI